MNENIHRFSLSLNIGSGSIEIMRYSVAVKLILKQIFKQLNVNDRE